MTEKQLGNRAIDILNKMYSEAYGPFKVTFDDIMKYSPKFNGGHAEVPYWAFYLPKERQDAIEKEMTKHLRSVWGTYPRSDSDEIRGNLENFKSITNLLVHDGVITKSTARNRIDRYATKQGMKKESPDANKIHNTIVNYAPSITRAKVDDVIDIFKIMRSREEIGKYIHDRGNIGYPLTYNNMVALWDLRYNMEHGIEGGTLRTYGNPFGNTQNWTGWI